MNKYQRNDNEDTIGYLLRLAEIKIEEKPDNLEWSDIVKYCGFDCHYDSLRKALQPSEYGGVAIYKYLKNKLVSNNTNESNDLSEDNILKQIEIAQREIYKERQKLRDEKNEYNTLLREQSRMELFFERIDESITKLLNKKTRNLPSPILIQDNSDQLFSAYADAHYGCEFSLKGFNNEILNEYNPDVFKSRMIEYRDELIDFGKIHNVKKLSLVDLGDSIEGILHISQLKSLKGNIVDDIMDYADFIEDWLFSLSEYFFIDFYTSEGNHSDLRILTGKKGDFPHENLERIYTRFMKKAFKNNPNVIIHDSLDGLNFLNVNGYNFLTAHGNKENNLKTSIQDYENTYGITVDYFVVGHLHSKNEFEVARGKEVIQVRSIMGINEFSRDIKKTSDAGTTMFVVREGYGRKYINDVKLK